VLRASLVVALIGFPVFLQQAEARGGGDGDWYADDGPNRGAVAAGLAVGAAVASLPSAYATLIVGGQGCYVSDGVYCQPCLVVATPSRQESQSPAPERVEPSEAGE